MRAVPVREGSGTCGILEGSYKTLPLLRQRRIPYGTAGFSV